MPGLLGSRQTHSPTSQLSAMDGQEARTIARSWFPSSDASSSGAPDRESPRARASSGPASGPPTVSKSISTRAIPSSSSSMNRTGEPSAPSPRDTGATISSLPALDEGSITTVTTPDCAGITVITPGPLVEATPRPLPRVRANNARLETGQHQGTARKSIIGKSIWKRDRNYMTNLSP
jgi:hypothetical protein